MSQNKPDLSPNKPDLKVPNLKVPLKSAVCILSECAWPDIGGGVTQAMSLANGLIRNGFSVFFLTQTKGLRILRYECVGTVPIFRIPTFSNRFGKYIMLVPVFFYLCKYKKKYNIIYVPGFRVLGVLGVICARLFRKKCILKAEGIGEFSGEVFRWGSSVLKFPILYKITSIIIKIRNIILKKADRFIAISNVIKDEFTNSGVDPKDIVYIPNGIDMKRFHPVTNKDKYGLREKLNLPQGKKIFIYTGRLNKGKGLELLLRVWKQIIDSGRDVYLILAGSGSYQFLSVEDELKDFVCENKLEDRVRFTGYVDNIEEYLMASDIFIFPSETESFGCSVAEALACGLPVISTNVGGIPDIVKKKDGILVNPNSQDELYKAIEEIILENSSNLNPFLSQEFYLEKVLQGYISLLCHLQ